MANEKFSIFKILNELSFCILTIFLSGGSYKVTSACNVRLIALIKNATNSFMNLSSFQVTLFITLIIIQQFVLKHDENRAVREVENYPNTLCPTHPDSFPLVTELLTQIMNLHLTDKYFHIGADEVGNHLIL